MHVTQLPTGGFLAFCGPVCVEGWLDDGGAAHLADLVVAVPGGPPWCLHCHHCAARCWRHPDCPLCPDCADGRWSATAQAAKFAVALVADGDHDVPPGAYEQARQFCARGFDPVFAARLVRATG